MDSASSVTSEREGGQKVRFTLTAGRWTSDSDVGQIPLGEEVGVSENLKDKLLSMKLDRICVASRLSSKNALHWTLLQSNVAGSTIENAGALYEQVFQYVFLKSKHSTI